MEILLKSCYEMKNYKMYNIMPLKMFEHKWAWNFIVNIPKGWNDKNSVKINFKKIKYTHK